MKDIKHFRKHVRHHEDTNEYFCDICGQKAPHKIALQNHKRRVHFTERTHKCNLCEKSFKTKLNLKVTSVKIDQKKASKYPKDCKLRKNLNFD